MNPKGSDLFIFRHYATFSRNLNNNKTPAKHRDIFRDTLIAKKYGEGVVRIHDLLAGGWETKKIQAPGRVRTQDLQPDWATIIEVTKCINGVEIEWFCRISFKKCITDHDFPPPFMWSENNFRLGPPAKKMSRENAFKNNQP